MKQTPISIRKANASIPFAQRATSFEAKPQHHWAKPSSFAQRATSFEAKPQHHWAKPSSFAQLHLRQSLNKRCCVYHANDVVPYGTNEKSESQDFRIFGWDGWIRTSECRSQSPVPYRLATPQYNEHIYYIVFLLCCQEFSCKIHTNV